MLIKNRQPKNIALQAGSRLSDAGQSNLFNSAPRTSHSIRSQSQNPPKYANLFRDYTIKQIAIPGGKKKILKIFFS